MLKIILRNYVIFGCACLLSICSINSSNINFLSKEILEESLKGIAHIEAGMFTKNHVILALTHEYPLKLYFDKCPIDINDKSANIMYNSLYPEMFWSKANSELFMLSFVKLSQAKNKAPFIKENDITKYFISPHATVVEIKYRGNNEKPITENYIFNLQKYLQNIFTKGIYIAKSVKGKDWRKKEKDTYAFLKAYVPAA